MSIPIQEKPTWFGTLSKKNWHRRSTAARCKRTSVVRPMWPSIRLVGRIGMIARPIRRVTTGRFKTLQSKMKRHIKQELKNLYTFFQKFHAQESCKKFRKNITKYWAEIFGKLLNCEESTKRTTRIRHLDCWTTKNNKLPKVGRLKVLQKSHEIWNMKEIILKNWTNAVDSYYQPRLQMVIYDRTIDEYKNKHYMFLFNDLKKADRYTIFHSKSFR